MESAVFAKYNYGFERKPENTVMKSSRRGGHFLWVVFFLCFVVPSASKDTSWFKDSTANRTVTPKLISSFSTEARAKEISSFVKPGIQDSVLVTFSPSELNLEVGLQASKYVVAILSAPQKQTSRLYFTYSDRLGEAGFTYRQKVPVIQPLPPIIFNVNGTDEGFQVVGEAPGTVNIGVNFTSPTMTRLQDATIRITVVQSFALELVTTVLGWVYFVSWSFSFYPQLFTNWYRKSVVGLSFDYVGYSLLGYTAYFTLQGGLYGIDAIQKDYLLLHPGGVIPVQLSDVIYPLHCLAVMTLMMVQCFIYERAEQKVSITCRVLLSIMLLYAVTVCILAACDVITWLTCVYWVSYIQLVTTTFKYLPQILLNYSRKSTEGWSIFMVLLDFGGGFFTFLQMLLIAVNLNDWSSLGGNITKFGLALISCAANVVFFIQHFILYRRHNGYSVIDEKYVQA